MPAPGPTTTPTSQRNEWGTPPEWLARVRVVLGKIDLDPATTLEANQFVSASGIYTKKNDGLVQPWFGKVFCNPPYGSGLIHPFCEKMASEWDRGKIHEMIALTNSDTSTRWTRRLFESADAVCFPYRRLAFIDPDTGEPVKGNNRPQAFWYWGGGHEHFARAFSEAGTVLPLGDSR